jgi:hypothetical protein
MASLIKRNGTFYLQWRVGGKLRRRSLHTPVLQLAKEKLRQFQSAQHRGLDDSLPTRTPLPEILDAYVEHVRHVKTPKSAQTDIYYLREAFGPVCDGLQIASRKVTEQSRKRPRKTGQDRRCRQPVIAADCFEAITTADVATFVTSPTHSRGLAPKTANRYREIIVRLFNWAVSQQGVRLPAGRNPAAAVERYAEPAPEIRYLTLPQIKEQLDALAKRPQLQTMVATYIYAGLRREEALWLTRADLDLRAGLIYVRAKTVIARSHMGRGRRCGVFHFRNGALRRGRLAFIRGGTIARRGADTGAPCVACCQTGNGCATQGADARASSAAGQAADGEIPT